MLRDIGNIRAIGVYRAARAMLSLSQDVDPRTTSAAIGIVFLLICERFGARPAEVLEVSTRVMRHFHEKEPHNLRALRRFLKEEF